MGEVLNIDNKNILKIYIKAPAVNGKANESLMDFFSKTFKIKKSSLRITKGLTQKYKTLEISGEPQDLKVIGDAIQQKILLQKK